MHKSVQIKRIIYLCGVITISWILYTCLHSKQRTTQTQSVFFLQNKFLSWTLSNKSIQEAIQTSNVYLYYQKKDYTQALQSNTGETAIDYYNRGIIKMKRAYDQAIKTEFSGLVQAQELIAWAQKDFTIAQKINTNKQLTPIIATNTVKIKQIDTIVTAKTCYVGAEEAINLLSGVIWWIQQTKSTLREEQKAFELNKNSLPLTCQQQRENIFSTSKNNIQTVQQASINQKTKEIQYLENKIDNPTLCLSWADIELIQSLQSTRQAIAKYNQEHQENILQWQQSTDKEALFCNQEKNDSTMNDTLQNTLQKLLSQFDSTTTNQNAPRANSQPSYIPLNGKEQKLLENINKKNRIRIRQIQRLRTDKQYQWFEYIKSLFTNFYGNSWDFISTP
jgi:hypothetical protein